MNQENYGEWYGPITEYRGQPVKVGEKEIEISFKLYESREKDLGFSVGGNSDINSLVGVKTYSASHLDMGNLLSRMVEIESKKSPVPNDLTVLLGNEYLVAMMLSEIGSDKAP